MILPVAVTLTVLLGLYVGAYYATVLVSYHVKNGVRSPTVTTFVARYSTQHTPHDEQRFGPLFRPIHWFDRRIRPHVWEPKH